MSEPIRLSVALVTRNRPESLRRCLGSLRAQDVQPHEIVVSDDSDAAHIESSRAVAEEAGARWIAGPRRGLYANRNATALACTGTHIRTMDDDHLFPPSHFAACLDAVQRDPLAFWSTGEAGYADGVFHARVDTASQLTPAGVGGPVSDPDDNWAVADGSTIYPREVFDRGLRMAEEFGYGSAYLEFGALLYRRGWRGRCVPGAIVEHHHDAAMLRRRAQLGVLYASLCFNLRFRPSRVRATRHALSSLVRQPSLAGEIPRLLRLMRQRWDS